MNDPKLSEIQQRRRNLEAELVSLLFKFEAETGLEVRSIEVLRTDISAFRTGEQSLVRNVRTDVVLP